MYLKCLHCDGTTVEPGTKADDCTECEGTGQAACDRTTCKHPAVVFNDDGEALCEDCAFEEAC